MYVELNGANEALNRFSDVEVCKLFRLWVQLAPIFTTYFPVSIAAMAYALRYRFKSLHPGYGLSLFNTGT